MPVTKANLALQVARQQDAGDIHDDFHRIGHPIPSKSPDFADFSSRGHTPPPVARCLSPRRWFMLMLALSARRRSAAQRGQTEPGIQRPQRTGT